MFWYDIKFVDPNVNDHAKTTCFICVIALNIVLDYLEIKRGPVLLEVMPKSHIFVCVVPY